MELIEIAQDAQKNAHSPYSNVTVGAAVRMKDGKIYTGCNIENVSFTPSVCAERVAIFKAVSDGYKKGDFAEIAVTASWEGVASPCGVCRQVMTEFFDDNVKIYLANSDGTVVETNLDTLLPGRFSEIKQKNPS